MNTLWVVVIAVVVIYAVYNYYAKKIDRDIIRVHAKVVRKREPKVGW